MNSGDNFVTALMDVGLRAQRNRNWPVANLAWLYLVLPIVGGGGRTLPAGDPRQLCCYDRGEKSALFAIRVGKAEFRMPAEVVPDGSEERLRAHAVGMTLRTNDRGSRRKLHKREPDTNFEELLGDVLASESVAATA